MSRLNHKPLNQAVYDHVRDLVLSGTLVPGEQINEIALAATLGVSRTPLREAIGQLVADGLVEDRPYRGKFVRLFSPKQIADLYEVRAVLESHAVRLATPLLTAEQVSHLRVILHETEDALAAGDLAWYAAADRTFHETLASYSDNQTLIESLQRLASQIQIVRSVANHDPEVVQRTALERPAVVAALEARDAEGAAELMREHIMGVCRAAIASHQELYGHEVPALTTVNGK
jgi:DNA-binding GntR family transcriptional regulator